MQSPSRWGKSTGGGEARTPERRNTSDNNNDTTQEEEQPYQPPRQRVTVNDLDVEEAEGTVVQVLEERHRQSLNPTGSVQHKIQRLEEAAEARRIDIIRKTHRRAASGHASHMLHQIEEEDDGFSILLNRRDRLTENDGLLRALNPRHNNPTNPYASNLDHHLLKGQQEEQETTDEFARLTSTTTIDHQKYNNNIRQRSPRGLPLHGHPKTSSSDYFATNQDGFVNASSNSSNNNQQRGDDPYASIKQSILSGAKGRIRRVVPRWIRELCSMCHPMRLFNNCHDILVRSQFLWIGFPCLLGSAFCVYILDNPRLHFLPGDTTLAVWLLFATRQTVTLGIARMTVYVLVDGLMLGTHLAVQTLGPLVTLTAATGKGWPAIMVFWGLWNLVLIHGDHPFQLNWLYWTEMELFNQNFGGLLVNSLLYTRILFAAILGGLFVSAKRTIFALRFGRKQVVEFRGRLKKTLADIVLIDEVATLAEQAEKEEVEESSSEEEPPSWDLMSPSLVQQNLNDILWIPKIEYQDSNTSEFSSKTPDEPANKTPANTEKRTSFADKPVPPSSADKPVPTSPPKPSRHTLRRTESGRIHLKDMLDSWDEPGSDSDKVSDISIHEILKFRRALSHLEEDNIFGEAFGSTASRDECIANSHSVYYRLLKLAHESDNNLDASGGRKHNDVLPFDVLGLLCLGDDGKTLNEGKKRKIRKLFTPDRCGKIPLLPFIQSIDSCYKKLVFLRASVRSASLLDRVLERLFNALFYFVLVLFLSSVLQLHPWTLMVSITSLLVSVSFALGSSISHYVEGVFLIAVRRPFDLGDRIIMSSADCIDPLPDVPKNSWLVEEVTLATTTLRYARTNEVCTVNNWSLSSTRIVNLARSPNAILNFPFSAHISILEGNKLEQFKKAIQKFVSERPRVWETLAFVRHDMADVGNEAVNLSFAIRHRSPWQEAGRIKNDRTEVFRFLYQLGNQLNVHFSAPAEQNIVYQGGALRRGDTDDMSSRDLIKKSNIRPIPVEPMVGGGAGKMF
ncbi:expressed unknown protein [Seminavis robusta]|uniref:Mechanosensitive ion channel MscS domain-containing protein n=1 Tax=Seminavis robusta TaxID=568900 RepID=A0A9N8H5A4_9STRA|nr:expressed unknown protein [Seminavis robusta]|eukprot:Sro108_g054310.1 n/a (1019) ;mRNA; f:94932-98405